MSVPALRFKDDDGSNFPEWEHVLLKDIARRVKNKNKEDNKNVLTISAQQGLINQEEYFNKSVAAKDLTNYYLLHKGDFAYNKSYSNGYPMGAIKCLNRYEKGVVSTLYICFKFSSGYVNAFFEQYFETGLHNKELEKVAQEGARNHGLLNIGIDDFFNISLTIPSKLEQTKIANFLTAVDEKITQLTQKYQLLTQHKKGVMQKIFSQELRFKDDDGQDFPEWNFVELEKVAVKVNKKNKDALLSNVLTNSATQGIVSQSDYFDRDIANQNNLGGYYIVETDDFVYNPRISANALVGPIKRNHLTVGVMSPLYTVFRLVKGNLDFYEQYFQTNYWHDYMKSISNTGARHDRMNITTESFFDLPLPYPIEKEQLKIASFLNAIDKKITTAQQKLASAKQYKQGLLQQLFV